MCDVGTCIQACSYVYKGIGKVQVRKYTNSLLITLFFFLHILQIMLESMKEAISPVAVCLKVDLFKREFSSG